MVKGDMCLKIVEQIKHRDIVIKQGEVSNGDRINNMCHKSIL